MRTLDVSGIPATEMISPAPASSACTGSRAAVNTSSSHTFTRSRPRARSSRASSPALGPEVWPQGVAARSGARSGVAAPPPSLAHSSDRKLPVPADRPPVRRSTPLSAEGPWSDARGAAAPPTSTTYARLGINARLIDGG